MNITILTVEVIAAIYLKKILNRLGYVVVGNAVSANEAVLLCEAYIPDIVGGNLGSGTKL